MLREGVEEVRLAEATAGIPGTQDPNNPPIALERLLGAGESGLGFLLDVAASSEGSFIRNDPTSIAAYVDYRPSRLVQSCSLDSDCNNGEGERTLQCTYGQCQIMTLGQLPQHEQPLGVPVKILETSIAYLKSLEAYLSRIAR